MCRRLRMSDQIFALRVVTRSGSFDQRRITRLALCMYNHPAQQLQLASTGCTMKRRDSVDRTGSNKGTDHSLFHTPIYQ